MEHSKIQKELTNLIAAGKTKAAFEWLNKQSLDQNTNQTLTIIQSEYKNLLNAEIKGTLSDAEIQAGKNRINDKLLSLFDPALPNRAQSKSNLLKIALPVLGLLIIAGLFFWMNNKPTYSCPTFSEDVNNKILVLPFTNLAAVERNPQQPLINKIEKLATKNKLSVEAEIGDEFKNMTMKKAPGLANECSANVIVWGNYEALENGTTQLTLQYHFLEAPNKSNLGETINLKNISSLQSGEMFKNFDDAIMSLCGILAVREGDIALAKKWFNKVKHKEKMDKDLLEVL